MYTILIYICVTKANNMTIQQILKEAGFACTEDNRANAVRSINSVLKNSKITISICETGRVWVAKNGFRYNVLFSLPGVLYSRFKTNNFDTYNILKLLASFLKDQRVKDSIYSEVETPCQCNKCSGTGFLPEFAYYANGVCFDCMGCGITGKLVVKNVQNKEQREKSGLPYIRTFHVTGSYVDLFPTEVENIQAVSHHNHPTAITYLGKKDGFFYIHAPICQRNDWYKIPETEFEKFAKEWNKFNNQSNHIKTFVTA